MKRIIYWFRRDLRLRDNRALAAALSAGNVAAIYVLDGEAMRDLEIGFDDPRFTFLLDVLNFVGSRIRLHVVYGVVREVFEDLLGRRRFDAVYTATPLSWSEEKRIREVEAVCRGLGVKLVRVLDNVLVDPSAIGTARNFSHFYRKWRGLVDSRVVGDAPLDKFIEIDAPDVGELSSKHGWKASSPLPWRVAWLHQRLDTFEFENYASLRDYPSVDGTSRLSPFINIGAVSVREVYNIASGRSNEFVRQLAWREFYYYLGMKYQWMRDHELKPHMRSLEWENEAGLLEAFEEGRTGYPIVDAGIRQLKTENWIHNRIRLILANFLTKDLIVDWRIGEKFFRRHLIDYDEVLNVGNWQWAASVGVDPLPLRIFNPVSQASKYDPDCAYIKRYIPELEGYDCRELHDPIKFKIRGYHEPIVDHAERIRKFKSLVEKARRSRPS